MGGRRSTTDGRIVTGATGEDCVEGTMVDVGERAVGVLPAERFANAGRGKSGDSTIMLGICAPAGRGKSGESTIILGIDKLFVTVGVEDDAIW